MLSVDMVEKAKSGHPGLPMGAAALAYVLWTQFLRHNPKNPNWLNRDRFVLSAGHGSALLYSLLHLTGYKVSLNDLKNFRQWGSITPGHPEYELTPGIETTTGPLGQGFATGVGMALAEYILASRYNKKGLKIIDYTIYGIVSDGDLMEGVSSEAASYAGTLGLGKIIYLYDSNKISIEGSTDLTFCENTAKRFEAYNWHVSKVKNGNDIDEIKKAIQEAKIDPRPSLIVCKTHIGFGSPNKQDSAKVHGSPLGEEEIQATRKNLGWPQKAFYIPAKALNNFRKIIQTGKEKESAWNKLFNKYQKQFTQQAQELINLQKGELPKNWEKQIPKFNPEDAMATRSASGKVLNAISDSLPTLIGGSADLAPSNNTNLENRDNIIPLVKPKQNLGNIHFGVREHAMAAILNGLALSEIIIPFGGTFLVFSDYMRGAMRLSALMHLRVIYVLTHDSVALGEDGPTHQPIEHLMALRAMPNLTVIRPADANETAAAWQIAITNTTGPTALVLTRQKLPIIKSSNNPSFSNLKKGAYILNPEIKNPDIILIATGSEVSQAIQAGEKLAQTKIKARVVSMPSWELFEAQSQEYKDTILHPAVTNRVSIEAGITLGWERYVKQKDAIIGIDHFGESAPGEILIKKFGLTSQNIFNKSLKIFKSRVKNN